jgi:hypothetical protein
LRHIEVALAGLTCVPDAKIVTLLELCARAKDHATFVSRFNEMLSGNAPSLSIYAR